MRTVALAVLLLSAVAPAFAAPLPEATRANVLSTPIFCGIPGGDVAELHAKVAKDARYKRDGGSAMREVWSAESIQAILTFTTPADPAHPAAICQQVIDRGGALRIDRSVRCGGSEAACAALDEAEDGSGDGE